LFIAEFTRYPPAMVKRTHLQRIVLCQQLSFAGQRRNAIPDFEHDVLYFDIRRGVYNEVYLRKVIHHEFFHIIDYRDDGNVYQDERWEKLNPPTFVYRGSGADAQDVQTTSVLTDQFPGFLNHYSTTAVEEDKAEVFANLMVNPDYVEKRAKTDKVLRAKVREMKRLLMSFYPVMLFEQHYQQYRFTAKARRAQRRNLRGLHCSLRLRGSTLRSRRWTGKNSLLQ